MIDSAFLTRQYFKGELIPQDLNEDEYQFYTQNLVIARSHQVTMSVLYFDKRNYNIVKGYCKQNFNAKSELVSRTYFVEQFKQLAVKDNLITKLKTEIKLEPKQVLFTNLKGYSILARKIAIDGEYDLLPLREPTDIDKTYEDLIGVIETQDKFFPDDTYFKEQVNLIYKSEAGVIKLPSTILSLIYWFYVLS